MKKILIALSVCLFSFSALAAPSESVRSAQTQLNQLYYDAGAEDGLMGPTTRKAIEDFQRDNGLESTGSLDVATKQALEDAVYEQEQRKAAITKTQQQGGPKGKKTPARRSFFSFHFGQAEAENYIDVGNAEGSYDLDDGFVFNLDGRSRLGQNAFIGGWWDWASNEDPFFDLDRTAMSFGVDAGYVFNTHDNLDFYVGGALSLNILQYDSGEGAVTDDSLTVGLQGIGGATWNLGEHVGLRAELRLPLTGYDGIGSEVALEVKPVGTWAIYLEMESKTYADHEIDGIDFDEASQDTVSLGFRAYN